MLATTPSLSIATAPGRAAPRDGALQEATRVRPRRRHREVVLAAARVFHDRGYEAASVQEIAAALGLHKGGVYYYVGSKERLLVEVVDEAHRLALAGVHRAIEVRGSALDKTRALVVVQLVFSVEQPHLASALSADVRRVREETREHLRGEARMFRDVLTGLLRQGKLEGVVRQDVDADLAALSILATIQSVAGRFRVAADRPLADVARSCADLVVAGLSPERLECAS